jgi:UDP-GlcNAc:undecaprenyl-phosphate/decaprenyl-phosphate GlcNAc-1-phosphate transferase
MIQAGIISIHLLLLIPLQLPDAVILVIGAASAFAFTYLLTFGVRAFCYKMGWLDHPATRRVHVKAVPRLGGAAMFVAFVLVSLLFYTPGSENEVIIYWLLLVAATLMVVVHAYDDILGMKPLPKLLAQTIAVVIVLGPWGGVFHGILLFTFNNPFGREFMQPGLPWYLQPTFFLLIHPASPLVQPAITFEAIPAILLTWFWTAGMMNTVNWIDGMDGLATGVVGIAGLFITLISFMLQQQSIAVLAAIFTGAVLGFLPHNWNPAKIFMGDTGAMFLGLGLAVLSIMGGAKLALALMVLGVPILDVAVVIINRVRRGQSPLHYDKTHLHHRLMATGLSVKQICWVIYGLSILFGLLALTLSGIHNAHFYKFVGVGLVGITMAVMIAWIDYRQRQRGVRIKLGGPEPTPTPNNGQEIAPAANDDGIYDTTGADQAEANEASQPRRNVLSAEELRARLPH